MSAGDKLDAVAHLACCARCVAFLGDGKPPAEDPALPERWAERWAEVDPDAAQHLGSKAGACKWSHVVARTKGGAPELATAISIEACQGCGSARPGPRYGVELLLVEG